MTGAAKSDTCEKCTAVLTRTLGHNEDGSALEDTAAYNTMLQSFKQGGEEVIQILLHLYYL